MSLVNLNPARVVWTIGYERATIQLLTAALTQAGIDLLVDVRAVASSRRPGFAKKALTAGVEEAGIGYLHLRGLGTPAAGRAAARAGDHAEMRRIYLGHLKTLEAHDDLDILVDLVESGRRVCLLCLEAQPEHCHRSMIGKVLTEMLPVQIQHLHPAAE